MLLDLKWLKRHKNPRLGVSFQDYRDVLYYLSITLKSLGITGSYLGIRAISELMKRLRKEQ